MDIGRETLYFFIPYFFLLLESADPPRVAAKPWSAQKIHSQLESDWNRTNDERRESNHCFPFNVSKNIPNQQNARSQEKISYTYVSQDDFPSFDSSH